MKRVSGTELLKHAMLCYIIHTSTCQDSRMWRGNGRVGNIIILLYRKVLDCHRSNGKTEVLSSMYPPSTLPVKRKCWYNIKYLYCDFIITFITSTVFSYYTSGLKPSLPPSGHHHLTQCSVVLCGAVLCQGYISYIYFLHNRTNGNHSGRKLACGKDGFLAFFFLESSCRSMGVQIFTVVYKYSRANARWRRRQRWWWWWWWCKNRCTVACILFAGWLA